VPLSAPSSHHLASHAVAQAAAGAQWQKVSQLASRMAQPTSTRSKYLPYESERSKRWRLKTGWSSNEACRRSNFLTIRFQDVLAAQQVIQLLFIGNVLNLVFHGM
jgi:hypothetical protein